MNHPRMVSGDDYTKGRDRLEPLLVLGIVGFSVLALLGVPSCGTLSAILFAGFLYLHLTWPLRWWLREGKAEALPYAGVTALRGFARTLGLCAGLLRLAVGARGADHEARNTG